MIRKIFFICLVAFLSSCSNNSREIDREEAKRVTIDLARQYNAIENWDSCSLFTYHYQIEFIEKNKPILFKGKIYDIVKLDSNYLVKVINERKVGYQNFIAMIKLTNKQFKIYFIARGKYTRVVYSFTQEKARERHCDADTWTQSAPHANLRLTWNSSNASRTLSRTRKRAYA